jgi:uncharacterized membrane protein YdbT with pleckstrin-like domain
MKRTIKPSQWVNIIWFLLAVGGGIGIGVTENFLFIIPILIWFWRFLVINCWMYKFDENSDTIVQRKGVLSVSTVEIHYFRIKSIQLREPLFQRLVGLSTVYIITSEPFMPYLKLYAIYDGQDWVKYIKESATYWRNVKGVKETDFHSF